MNLGEPIGEFMGMPLYATDGMNGFAIVSTLSKGTPVERYHIVAWSPMIGDFIERTVHKSELFQCTPSTSTAPEGIAFGPTEGQRRPRAYRRGLVSSLPAD